MALRRGGACHGTRPSGPRSPLLSCPHPFPDRERASWPGGGERAEAAGSTGHQAGEQAGRQRERAWQPAGARGTAATRNDGDGGGNISQAEQPVTVAAVSRCHTALPLRPSLSLLAAPTASGSWGAGGRRRGGDRSSVPQGIGQRLGLMSFRCGCLTGPSKLQPAGLSWNSRSALCRSAVLRLT